jgi:hypothetical protein
MAVVPSEERPLINGPHARPDLHQARGRPKPWVGESFCAEVWNCLCGPQAPLKVVKKCYRQARRAAQTDKELKRDAPQILANLIAKPGRTVVVAKSPPKAPTQITSKTVALRFVDHGIAKLGLLDGVLQRELGSKKLKDLFIAGLGDVALLAKGHGNAGTYRSGYP